MSDWNSFIGNHLSLFLSLSYTVGQSKCYSSGSGSELWLRLEHGHSASGPWRRNLHQTGWRQSPWRQQQQVQHLRRLHPLLWLGSEVKGSRGGGEIVRAHDYIKRERFSVLISTGREMRGTWLIFCLQHWKSSVTTSLSTTEAQQGHGQIHFFLLLFFLPLVNGCASILPLRQAVTSSLDWLILLFLCF